MDDDSGSVTPLRRPAPEPLPPEQAALHRRTRKAQPGARQLAADQAAPHRAAYQAAVTRQEREQLIASGQVVPARITTALDINGLYGPEVDIACGAGEPDVDMWELGLAVPTAGQVRKLAALTGFNPAYFYQPLKPGPLTTGPVFMCGRHCEISAPDVIDENGVLLYEGKPRELPKPIQGSLF